MSTDKRREARPPTGPTNAAGKYDMRLSADIRARIKRQSDRLAVKEAAYIRQAIIRQLEADEATDPSQDAKA